MILKFMDTDGYWRMYGGLSHVSFIQGITLRTKKDKENNDVPYFEDGQGKYHTHWDVGNFNMDVPPQRKHCLIHAYTDKEVGVVGKVFIFSGSGYLMEDGKTVEHLN